MSAKKKLDTDQMASELSESAFFHPTSPQVDKPAKPHVDKYTTHLPADIIEAVKSYAFFHKMKDYEVVRQALVEFLERNK